MAERAGIRIFPRSEPVYPYPLPKTMPLETDWVLRYSHGQPLAVMEALDRYEAGMDFADALHLASGRQAEAFATFDARLKKRVGGERGGAAYAKLGAWRVLELEGQCQISWVARNLTCDNPSLPKPESNLA